MGAPPGRGSKPPWHLRLRHLAATVDAASCITGTDEEVVKAGSALRAFAVFLDDLIDAEEKNAVCFR
jgi:hypothetical protein